METLKELRTSKNLSQRKIANMADITTNTYNCIEQGLGNPRLDTIIKLATSLGIEASELTKILVSSKLNLIRVL